MERGFLFRGPRVLPEPAELGFQLGVGGLVNRVARLDALEVDAAVGAVEDKAPALDLPDARALFEVAVLAGVEDHAVARRDGNAGGVPQFDPAVAAFRDLA